MSKLKVKDVKRYVNSGVNFDSNMYRAQAILALLFYLGIEWLMANGRGGVYRVLLFVSAPVCIASSAAIFILTTLKRSNHIRLILNTVLSFVYLLSGCTLSVGIWFMFFGVSWIAFITLLPPLITGLLIPIKINKDLGQSDKFTMRKTAVGSVTASGIVGLVAGFIGRKIAKVFVADANQTVAGVFLLTVQVAALCWFTFSFVTNLVKLYWHYRLEKRHRGQRDGSFVLTDD